MTKEQKLEYIQKFILNYYEYGGISYEHPEYSAGQLETLLDIILQICNLPEGTEAAA